MCWGVANAVYVVLQLIMLCMQLISVYCIFISDD
jgi:hypothetical protein